LPSGLEQKLLKIASHKLIQNLAALTFAYARRLATSTGCFKMEEPGWVISNDWSVSNPLHFLIF
jgi:hypothetical protein